MEQHSRTHLARRRSEQARASLDIPFEGLEVPGISSRNDSSPEDNPPVRGLGRGKLLALGQNSSFIGRSRTGTHSREKSAMETVSKEFQNMHLEQRQDVPASAKRPVPATRPCPTERPVPATRPCPTERPVPAPRTIPSGSSALTEKPPPTGRSAQADKPAPMGRSALTEKPPPTGRSAQADKPAPMGRSPLSEKPPPTGRSTQADKPAPMGRSPLSEKPPPTGRSAQADKPAPAGRSTRTDRKTTPTERSTLTETIGETMEKSVAKRNSVNLLTNYVRLQTDPNVSVYEYEVTFSPDVEFVNFRYRLLYHQFHGKKDVLCYDGSLKLFTPERITDDIEEFVLHHPVDESVIIMSVKLKRKAAAKDCASVFNTLFHNCSRILRLTRFGNKYFDSEEAIDIPQHKLEIWPGYVTAIDDFDGGIQLRCDVNHRVLRTETVLDVLTNLASRGPEYVKAMALRDLIGQCVLTRYNNSLYRIDDIDWTKTPLSTFTLNNGETISFIQYYKRQYNLDITDTKQPLLINRAKEGKGGKRNLICLVPEICYMTGLNDKMRNDIKVMKDIARYTRVTPNQRIYAFQKFLENVKNNEEVQNLFRKWGLKIVDDLVELKGKNLEPETLVFGNDVTLKAINYDWMRSLRNLNVYRSVNLKNWIIFYPSKHHHVADDFTSMIKRIGPGLGLSIQEPTKISLRDDRIETYINSLRTNIRSSTQIVVCICPTAREDRYNAIKKFCCKELPIPSQVVNVITLSKEERMRPVVQNIALQINHKIGGAGWSIHIPFNGTMVCGVDVYHDKNHASGSVGAFVASRNKDCTEWFSKTNFQGAKEELIFGIVDAFTNALKAYLQKNGAYPNHIIVFRDGVSDGQLDVCLQYEVTQFLNAFKIAEHDYRPEFIYIIVQKRIATKFYKKMDGRAENPTPGGVVDSIITKKGYMDFYLVSQLVRSGTASPTHYIVLYDNSSAKIDYLQRLTYKFCHLYYNWPGTIRVPAPCQYAHKLAYLVGQNIKCKPDESLDDKLFYL